MVGSEIIVFFLILLVLSFIIFEIISFIFWLSMLTDALKRRDSLWITLLTVGILTGLDGLFAALYYEIMYKDEQGHHKSCKAFILMMISFILLCLLAIAFFVILIFDGTSIISSISDSIARAYSVRY